MALHDDRSALRRKAEIADRRRTYRADTHADGNDDTDREGADGEERDEGRAQGQGDDRKSPGVLHSRLFKILAFGIVLVLAITAFVWWLNARQFETTDDAFIDVHIVHLSPQIAGRVTDVYVNDNVQVHKGQPLVEIDPADAQAQLNQAEAQQAQAEAQYRQSVANEKGVAAQAENAKRDFERYHTLQRTAPQALSQQQLDQTSTTARNTEAQLAAAQAQIATAQAQIEVYRAQVATAGLNLHYTHIVSPGDGYITQRSVAVGNYVSPGQELMAIVPLDLWVTANFKETQLDLMRPGQAATIEVDACPGKKVRGHVDSLQRGAGQAFGILPPENATGNFVKVVQRVPVKIILDNVPKGCPIGPGMSVEPTVKVR